MIELGKINRLRVLREKEHGFYLEDDEASEQVLLPNKYAPESLQVDDEIDVFVYNDSEDMVIATTQKPYAMVGEFASLAVKSVEDIGVFLDWGLDKDLFVPFREQIHKMSPGKKYAVYIYLDSSDRIAASTRIKKFLSISAPSFKVKEKVKILPYQSTDLGVNVVINGSHTGLVHNSDIAYELKLGEWNTGYIKTIREDHKIDVILIGEGLTDRKDLSDQILDKLKAAGGSLDVNSKTSADVINRMFNVSRKKFKIALGYLYKQKIIEINDNGISLIEK